MFFIKHQAELLWLVRRDVSCVYLRTWMLGYWSVYCKYCSIAVLLFPTVNNY